MIQFSPDGRFFATAGGDNLVKLWETSTLGRHRVPHPWAGTVAGAIRAEYAPDGRTLVTTGWGIVRLWDAASGRHVRDIETGISTGVYGLAIRPDGRVLATTHEDHEHVFSAVGPIRPDSRVLATAQERGPKEIDLWDVATGRRLRKLVGHGVTVKGVAFHPDGRTLASASGDRTIRLWDTTDGRTLAVLEGHSATVVALAFSPDGRRLASKGWDHTVRLWDVATRRVIRLHEGVRQHFSNAICQRRGVQPGRPAPGGNAR